MAQARYRLPTTQAITSRIGDSVRHINALKFQFLTERARHEAESRRQKRALDFQREQLTESKRHSKAIEDYNSRIAGVQEGNLGVRQAQEKRTADLMGQPIDNFTEGFRGMGLESLAKFTEAQPGTTYGEASDLLPHLIGAVTTMRNQDLLADRYSQGNREALVKNQYDTILKGQASAYDDRTDSMQKKLSALEARMTPTAEKPYVEYKDEDSGKTVRIPFEETRTGWKPIIKDKGRKQTTPEQLNAYNNAQRDLAMLRKQIMQRQTPEYRNEAINQATAKAMPGILAVTDMFTGKAPTVDMGTTQSYSRTVPAPPPAQSPPAVEGAVTPEDYWDNFNFNDDTY